MQRIRGAITYNDVSGGPGLITLYTRSTGLENDATAALTSSRLEDALTAGKALFSVHTSVIGETFVDDIDPATGAITGSHATDPWTVTGTTSGATGPAVLQICATWKTSVVIAGRRVAGRTFIGPLTNAVADTDGTPSAPYMTAALALAAAWIDNGLTDTFAVVWHRPVGGSGGTAEDITSYSVKDKFAVLRSRRD